MEIVERPWAFRKIGGKQNELLMKSLLLLLLLSLYATSGHTQSNSNKTPDKILAFSVPYGRTAIIGVPCDDFLSTFKDFRFDVVLNDDSLQTFRSFVRHVVYSDEKYLDVRAKFVYVLNDKYLYTVCTDGREIVINGRQARTDTAFVNFLNSMVRRHVPEYH